MSKSLNEMALSNKNNCLALKNQGIAKQILEIEAELTEQLDQISFKSACIHTIYNPLTFAAEPHEDYLFKYCDSIKKVMFIGMNPGPYGMCQNGVPFGEINIVKDWLKVTGHVDKPENQNANKPIEGFNLNKSEVSGRRLWGILRQLAKTPEVLFKHTIVYNYCPLCFLTSTGKNVTPDRLNAIERKRLIDLCNDAMQKVITVLQPQTIVAVGNWTKERLAEIQKQSLIDFKLLSILHPSPINPATNHGYEEKVIQVLRQNDLIGWITDDQSIIKND